MEMSSPGEETFFAKKNSVPLISLSRNARNNYSNFLEKKYPPASPKKCLLHPIPHTKNVSGGGAGASKGGGVTLVILGVLRIWQEGSDPWIALGVLRAGSPRQSLGVVVAL